MIEIDGSYEEGGGQILRTALGLSILTGKPFRIMNIRKKRPKPGLKAQHISCIKACAEMSNASVEGNREGSDMVEFVPRTLKNRQMEINIGTAGSITLLIQSILLPMMFTDCTIKAIGGTDVKWSMPIDYFKSIVLPIVNCYSNMQISCEKRGYYPEGGGNVNIITKAKFRAVDFDSFEKFSQYIFGNPPIDLSMKGKIICLKGISNASKNLQERGVAERQAKSVEIALKQNGPASSDYEYSNTNSTGSGVVVYAIFECINGKQYRIGADVIGESRMKAKEVSRLASEKLAAQIKMDVTVDEHLQDNIIPLLGLFGGKIRTGKITPHTKANIYACEKFLNIEYKIEKIKTERAKADADSQSEANFISVLSSSRS
jgi:RNA 3'-phosphate cyclase